MKKNVTIYSLVLLIIGVGIGIFGKEFFSFFYPSQESVMYVDFQFADAHGDIYQYVPVLPEIPETLLLSEYAQDINTRDERIGDKENGTYLEYQASNGAILCVKENIYAKEIEVYSSRPKEKYTTGGSISRMIIDCGDNYFISTFDAMGPLYFGPFIKEKQSILN